MGAIIYIHPNNDLPFDMFRALQTFRTFRTFTSPRRSISTMTDLLRKPVKLALVQLASGADKNHNLALWLRLLPLLRGNPPPIPTYERAVTLLPRPLCYGCRVKSISSRWLDSRTRHRDQEILQHILDLLA